MKPDEKIPWLLIKSRMDAMGKRPAWLAKELGVGPNTVSNWKTRGGAPLDKAPALAKLLKCSTDELLSAHHRSNPIENVTSRYNPPAFVKNVSPGPDVVGLVPLISWVQAGNWGEVSRGLTKEDAEDWLPAVRRVGPRAFALRVDGISMEPKYQDGDIIFVDPDAHAENRKRVIVQMDDEPKATFKELVIEDGLKYLRPLNPEWPGPKVIPINGNATIVGVVVGKWVPE